MLNNRKCFFFFTILILLLSGMTVVSATDNSDSNTTIADTDTIMSTDTVASNDINIQSDNKETFSYEDGKDDTAGNSKSVTKQDITNRDTKTSVSISRNVSNYTELVEAVNEVVSYNDNRTTDFTINLLEGDYKAITTMEMQINPDAMYFKTLTIEGNGIELDGLYTYQFMKLNFSYILKLKDISFTRFCSDRGGVISNAGNVSISGCNFTNNFAFEYGGVIYNEEYYVGGGNVEVTNSNFNNNFINNTAGAIFSRDGNVMVSDSTFIDNTALWAGAIFNNKESNLTLTNSVFKNNKAVNAGGAIYDQGIGVITDCHFENNNASSKGGALFVQNSTNESVIHSTFKSNFAEKGGSISVENAHVFISDSRFENDIRNEFGSGLLNEGGNVVVTGTNFTTIGYNSNQTIIFPNGTFPNSTILFIQNSVYGDGNTVDNYGGAISNFAGNLSVTGSNFNKCEALMYGGAIINYQEGNLSVIGTTFEDNSAEYGGAIFNYYGIVDVTDSEFKRSYADLGASIFNEGGILTVSVSNFTNNSARKGSAIYSQNDGTITVTGSNFTSNMAGKGSAIYNSESNLIINDSSFVENNAYNGSGVVYNDRGTFKLKNSYFKGNTPENFRIQNSKINLIENENYIDVNTVSICLDDDNTPVYTGSLNGYTVSKGHTIRVIVNGTDLNAFSNNEFDLGFIDYDSAVDSYDALVQAVEMARTSMQDSYKISLLPGDYNATTNMVWYKVPNHFHQ